MNDEKRLERKVLPLRLIGILQGPPDNGRIEPNPTDFVESYVVAVNVREAEGGSDGLVQEITSQS